MRILDKGHRLGLETGTGFGDSARQEYILPDLEKRSPDMIPRGPEIPKNWRIVLMPQQYLAKVYPAVTQRDSTQPVLGICLSGGGSRALSCALGQLSALNAMTLPNGQPVLGPDQYISSVSGGSWASVLYTFLPQTINGNPVSDADLLIEPVAPGSLIQGIASNKTPGNVAYIGPYCMGTAPQQFSLSNIGVFLKTLMDTGFFLTPSQWSWFWIAGVGEIILKPFGLYSATYNVSGPFVQPSQMFSLSAEQVSNSITKYNP